MSRDLSQLGTTRIADPSSLRDVPGHRRDYNEAYVKIATSLIEHLHILKDRYGADFRYKDILGEVRFRVVPDKNLQELQTLEVPIGSRFYPSELESGVLSTPEIYIPQKQLTTLIQELSGIAKDQVYHSGTAIDKRTALTITHRIRTRDYKPLEEITLQAQENGTLYTLLSTPANQSIVIEPEAVNWGELNNTLAAFDTTESGVLIPIGYNRLILMDGVLRQLVEMIEKRSGKVQEADERLKKIQSS